ncbi:MAG: hypothetical protein N2746_06765 [Deltaproteobacteria bacterium]|nr:hypothetical protein [Deltaproteobacteria bacterium]
MRDRVLFIFMLLMCGNLFGSEIPSVITHQGYIMDKEGKGVTGELNISVGIYKSMDGGDLDLVWEEDLGVVRVRDGFYFVRIGDRGGLKDIFSGYSVLFLEIRINGRPLSPRQVIGSVPYAFVAYDAVGDIHPRSVSVGGREVIDEMGRWVGDIPMGRASATSDGYLAKEDYSKFSGKQERVSGSCGVNMCMVSVNADGSVNCAPCGGGGGGNYTAGAGLVLNNYQFSLDTAYLTGSAYDSRFVNTDEVNSISGKMIRGGAVEGYHLSTDICGGVSDSVLYFDGNDWRCRQYPSGVGTVTVVNTGAGLQGGPITTSGTISLRGEYQSGSVYDDRFVNVGEMNSVDTNMIKDRAVTFSKIANGGCGTNQYIKWDGSNWSCGTISGGGTVTQINTAAPLMGGPITTSGTITIQQATASTSGYLSAADYQRFDAKQDALGYTPVNRAGDTMTGALNLPANGLTVGGNQLAVRSSGILWGSYNYLSTDQDGSIELGNSTSSGKTPFIDFHFGVGVNQDYNVRIINDANGRLTINAANFYVNGNIRSSTGQPVYRQANGCVNGGSLTTNLTCQTVCCAYDYDGYCYGYYDCNGSCQYWVYTPYNCNNTLLGKLISP